MLFLLWLLGADFGIDSDGDDDLKMDYPCPFCSEDFDVVNLCSHIDEEHPDAGSGVCITDHSWVLQLGFLYLSGLTLVNYRIPSN